MFRNLYLIIVFIIVNVLQIKAQQKIESLITKQKKLRFGFNLDWNMGYSFAKSGAPLEFLGRQPLPEVFGGSFDFLYKSNWLFNFSWKVKQNNYRIIHNFKSPDDLPHANKNLFGYTFNNDRIRISKYYQSFGLNVSKHLIKKWRYDNYLDIGISLNLFEFSEFSQFSYNGITMSEEYFRSGNAIFFLPFYDVRIYSKPSAQILDNRFMPNVYKDSGVRPIFGLFGGNGNAPKYYQVSYKIGYTIYYRIAKGKLQFFTGIGFEYFPFPFLVSDYTLYSKYDNINTSGTFSRSLTNAFIKLGFRFGKMGVEHFRY